MNSNLSMRSVQISQNKRIRNILCLLLALSILMISSSLEMCIRDRCLPAPDVFAQYNPGKECAEDRGQGMENNNFGDIMALQQPIPESVCHS